MIRRFVGGRGLLEYLQTLVRRTASLIAGGRHFRRSGLRNDCAGCISATALDALGVSHPNDAAERGEDKQGDDDQKRKARALNIIVFFRAVEDMNVIGRLIGATGAGQRRAPRFSGANLASLGRKS